MSTEVDLEFARLYKEISKSPILMRRVINEFIKRGKVRLTKDLAELTDSGVEKVFHHIHKTIGKENQTNTELVLDTRDVRNVL